MDDDVSVRRALERLLRSYGLRVDVYPSAEAFLGARNDRRHALLVVDLAMGEMSGLDLLETLSERGDATSAVVITAHDTPYARERARRCGVHVLRKPVDGRELLEHVERAVGRALVEP